MIVRRWSQRSKMKSLSEALSYLVCVCVLGRFSIPIASSSKLIQRCIYLLERQKDIQQEGQLDTKSWLLFIDSLSKCLQRLELGSAEARIQELNLGLCGGWRGLRYWSHHLLSVRMCISR